MGKKHEPREGAFSPNDELLERKHKAQRHAPSAVRAEDEPPQDEEGEFEEEPDRISS